MLSKDWVSRPISSREVIGTTASERTSLHRGRTSAQAMHRAHQPEGDGGGDGHAAPPRRRISLHAASILRSKSPRQYQGTASLRDVLAKLLGAAEVDNKAQATELLAELASITRTSHRAARNQSTT
jgi:hypothetical protein